MERKTLKTESETVIELLRRLIDEAGITQAELSRRIGWTQQNLSNVFRGARGMNAESLLMILRATGHRVTLAAEPAARPRKTA